MPILVDSLALRNAIKRFSRHNKNAVLGRYSFEQWLEWFRQDCNSFSNIAEITQVSKQRVSQIYMKYFAELIPRRPDGHTRQRMCTTKKWYSRIKESSAEILNDNQKKIIAIVSPYNFEIKTIPIRGRNGYLAGFHRRSLRINGKICSIRVINSAYPIRKDYENIYGRLITQLKTLKEEDFLIISFSSTGFNETTFVVPTLVLLDQFKPGQAERVFYLPIIKRPVYKNHRPLIDYWNYENAWHLLATPNETSRN
jgi:hypothetical protein